MPKLRVFIELEVDLEDADALQEAAAEEVYAQQRNAARAGRIIETDAGQEGMIEKASKSSQDSLAHLIQFSLPYKDGWPGCRLGHSDVRVQLAENPSSEARVRGARA